MSSQQSLAWDNFTPSIQQEDDLIFYYETSSTSGLASDTLQERELEQFIEEPDRLTPVDERSESRASTGEHERTMAGENAAGGPGDDVVAAALLEVEDLSVEVEEDFAPYIGQQLTWESKELKKLLRGSDLLLKHARVVAYDDQKQAMVQEAKTTLTAAMRHFDTLLVTHTAEWAATGAAGDGRGCRWRRPQWQQPRRRSRCLYEL